MFPGRTAGSVAGGGLGPRGLGARLRVGLQRAHHTEAYEIALHLGRRFNPRRLLLGLGLCMLALGLLDLLQSHGFGYSLRLFDLTNSDIRTKLSFSATATSALLLAAAWLSFALHGVDPRRSRAHWDVAGAVFLFFAVQELFGFQHWAETTFDYSASVYLPLILLTAVAWLGPLYTLRTRQWLHGVFALAMIGWLGAWLIDASQPSSAADPAMAELAELVAAGLFCIALLGRLKYISDRIDPLGQIEAPEVSRAAAQLVARLDLERFMVVIGMLIVAFALQDVIFHTGDYRGHQMPVLDVNTEQTIPATFSALLLIGAGGLAMLAAGMSAMRRADRYWWKWLGVILVLLAFEEVAAIHDTFQDVTDLPGQLVLVPIALAGVVVWWQLIARTVGRPLVRTLLIVGAATWFVSQASDALLNPVMRWAIVPEEALEMAGSSLWLLATALLVRSLLGESERLRDRDSNPDFLVQSPMPRI